MNNNLENVGNIIDSINSTSSNCKKIKKESGLIEKTIINKVILTEDNKQLLTD